MTQPGSRSDIGPSTDSLHNHGYGDRVESAGKNDAFGAALVDFVNSGSPTEELLLEVDDGRVLPAMAAEWFFLQEPDWVDAERNLLAEAVKGPVLDIGAGAGRLALHFQSLGWPVVAVDLSPGAVEVCRRRGVVDARLGDLRDPPTDKAWSTILLMCGNLGLAGGWDETRQLLSRLHQIAAPEAVILADSVDPTRLDDDGSRLHVERNRSAGRPPWPDLATADLRIEDVAVVRAAQRSRRRHTTARRWHRMVSQKTRSH